MIVLGTRFMKMEELVNKARYLGMLFCTALLSHTIALQSYRDYIEDNVSLKPPYTMMV
jgi:hypothetical protein